MAGLSLNPFQNSASGQQSGVVTPSVSVSINGKSLGAPLSMEVTNTSNFEADKYQVTLSIDALPKGIGLPFFDALGKDTVIQIGAGSATGQSSGGLLQTASNLLSKPSGGQSAQPLITGQVDTIEIRLADREIILTGRDLSARFIDNKTSETFLQQTSSQVVTLLAARRKLQVNAQATTAKIGTFYELQNSKISSDHTEWDLLVELAKHEDFDLWMSNQTLNFQPRLATSGKPYLLNYTDTPASAPLPILGSVTPGKTSGNFIYLDLSWAMTLASNIVVNVRSFNQKTQTSFTKTCKITKDTSANAAAPQQYDYRFANMTPDGAQKMANSLAEDISRHERTIKARMPGDNTLSTRMMVQLTGTKTKFDQLYFPDSVTRHLSQHDGYLMEMTAKNHSTPVSVTTS